MVRIRRLHMGRRHQPDQVPRLQPRQPGVAAMSDRSRKPATCSCTAGPWGPQLDEVMVANSLGGSRYRGLTLGIRKRFSNGYQLEANYVLAKDEDNDSNERDPFTDRSFNFFDLSQDWGPSDRDIRHKFNLFGYFGCGGMQPTRGCRAAARSRSRRTRVCSTARSRTEQRTEGQHVLLLRLAPPASVQVERRTVQMCRSSRCSTRSTTRTTSIR